MKNVRNGSRRAQPADTRPKESGRRRTSAAAGPRGKPVSAAEVGAPWQGYERRLAAKSARRLRDHAPNFLVVAPPKTATSWVYAILSSDRRFFMPEKECRYFSHFWREYPLASYYAQFQNPFGAVWRGEASPSYFILPSSVIATIREELPETRLIVLLRDPGERLWSHARHTFKYKEGWFRSSTAWRIEEVSETGWCHALLHPVIRTYNDYAGPLARWAEHFPAEQILILTSEMADAEPERAAQQIYDFLGLEKPTPDSPLLHSRPNASPRVALPGAIAELLGALTSAGRSRLEAALSRLPERLASDLQAAMAYWRNTDQPATLATTLPKPPGMPPQPNWDPLTTATFPADLLSWSYHSGELPPNSELLNLASLNFEYSYFSAPSEKGMAEESLLRHVQTLGTSIIEHDARLSGIEQTAVTLRERIGGLETPDAIRDQRLSQLEQTIEERSARLSSLESSLENYSELISSLAARDTTRDERLAAIEAGIEEHRRRIASTEVGDALRDERLGSLEQTIDERTGRLFGAESRLDQQERHTELILATNNVRDERLNSLEGTIEERTGRLLGVENRLDQQERHTDLLLATNNVRDERLSSLEGTLEQRTGRLVAVEGRLEQLQRRVTAQEAELRETIARHSDRAAVLETLLRQQVDRIAGVEHAAAERKTESAAQNRSLVELTSGLAEAVAGLTSLRAEQQRLQVVGGEVAELRATIEKALYAVALLQESLQGVEADLSQSRLSRIEAELSSVSGSGEKPNSRSLI